MTEPEHSPAVSIGSAQPPTDAERAVDELLDEAQIRAPHQLPGLLARHGEQLGMTGAVAYLADLQQEVLVPFLGSNGPALDESVTALSIDSTLAGRAYQQVELMTQELPGGRLQVWLPLLDGSDRLGVLALVP